MTFSPIVLFVYNRPWHTKQTIEALLKNPESASSDILIFSDGPKKDTATKSVKEVREYIRSVTGFRSVVIHESPSNKGLAKSIISGVTQVLERYETVIVLEDDMITSPGFLRYMNQALDKYKDEDQVVSIHGYWYPVEAPLPSTFFLKGAECWGWATWKRGWAVFSTDSWKLLKKIVLQGKIREFDMDNGYPYTRMLLRQCLGQLDSWAIRWYASAFLANKLTLYPGHSLIENIGLDDSGTHNKSWSKQMFESALYNESIPVENIAVVENRTARSALSDYFRKSRLPLAKKIYYTFKGFFK